MDTAQAQRLLTLYKAYAKAPAVRQAEKGAAGTMPTAAFQFCEAMRIASSFGWYVYPPKDISLVFDGEETYIFEDDAWIPLKSYNLEDEFRQKWRSAAPDHLADFDPPYISELSFPGHVQIWSGYFVKTAPNWSLQIRGPVNFGNRSSFFNYEGVIETDTWTPAPLFGNIKLLKTDVEIHLSHQRPLFQIVPVFRALDMKRPLEMVEVDIFDTEGQFDWEELPNTLRHAVKDPSYRPGRYATQVRNTDRRPK